MPRPADSAVCSRLARLRSHLAGALGAAAAAVERGDVRKVRYMQLEDPALPPTALDVDAIVAAIEAPRRRARRVAQMLPR